MHEGQQLYKHKEYKAAAEEFTQALNANPKIAEAYLKRAECKLEMGLNSGCITDINDALKLGLSPERVSSAHCCRAEAYRNVEDLPKALADYAKAIQLTPNYYSAYFGRARTHMKGRQFKEAIADYSKTIELGNKRQPKYYFERGSAYLELKDYANALRDFNKATLLGDNGSRLHLKKARSLYALGQYEPAVQEFTSTTNIDPKCAAAYEGRALAHEKLGKPDLAKIDREQAHQLLQQWGLE